MGFIFEIVILVFLGGLGFSFIFRKVCWVALVVGKRR